MAGEIGAFVVGTDVIGGSGAGALPGTFVLISGAKPHQGIADKTGPKTVTAVT